jgi:hypothetical protein
MASILNKILLNIQTLVQISAAQRTILTDSDTDRYLTTRFYIQHTIGTEIAILGILLNIQDCLFHKVVYSRHDVLSNMF